MYLPVFYVQPGIWKIAADAAYGARRAGEDKSSLPDCTRAPKGRMSAELTGIRRTSGEDGAFLLDFAGWQG